MCDRDLFNESILQRFLNLEHPHKLLFISKKWKHVSYENTYGAEIVNIEYQNECPNGYQLYRNYPVLQYLQGSTKK